MARMDPVVFSVIDAESPPARWALRRYFAELDARFVGGFDGAGALDEAGAVLNPPHGLFVIAGPAEAPTACGGVCFIDSARAEIKRMWVAPGARGQGLATQLLHQLEQLIARTGRASVVLDTNSVLTEAIRMYERCGYRPIARYNDNPYAHLWFGKQIEPVATGP